jgi:hypothetical protein
MINVSLKNFAPPQPFFILVSGLFLSLILLSCTTLKTSGVSPAADSDYQSRLSRAWQLLNKRQHRLALVEFTEARTMAPGRIEPVYGRARALFHMNRFAETLAACAEIGAAPADNYEALGFCWGARLEIGGAGPEVKEEVARELAGFLDDPAPSPELLYSLYKGYYYLQEREKGRQLLLRLAAMAADPSLAGSIAGSLFEEIVATAPGSEIRVKLAASYLDNFPEEKMVDKAALVVLGSLSTSRDGEIDHRQLVRTFLENRPESLLIRGAAAYWLLEQETGYIYAAELLEENLRALEDYRATRPPHFSPALWEEQVEEKRAFYRYLLGRAWLGLGEAGKAAVLLDEVLGERRDWPGGYHFRGLSAIRQGQIAQAVNFLRMALAAGSERPETERLLSDLLRDHYGFSGEPLAYFQNRESGVRFREVCGQMGLDGVKALRAAWGDYDNDGDDDLLLDGLRLFTNMGAAGFVERDRLIPSGLGPASGGVWGDYDNDRFLDIAVTARGGSFLLHNEAGERFTRVELPSPATLFPVNPEAAAWGELNNDGYLDLYLANYEHGRVLRGQCGRDRLLVNQSGRGFRDVTVAAGAISDEDMCGRGVLWTDLNGDGRQEIVVANYRLDPNFLWFNRGGGNLRDVAEAAGVRGHEVEGAYGHSIGSAAGDLDGDLALDLFVSNLAHPRYIEFSDRSMVLLNRDDRSLEFTDLYPESGLAFDETSADPLLFDADNDGDLDLYITSVYQGRSSHLYLNDGRGRFSDGTWLAGAGVENGWGAAAADYDGDGYLDLLVASPDGVRLLHNEGGGGNWLALKIDDRRCNRYGVGSQVLIAYDGQRRVREVAAGRGTGSQDSPTAHFGLGSYSGPVEIRLNTLCGDNLPLTVEEPNRLVVIGNQGE